MSVPFQVPFQRSPPSRPELASDHSLCGSLQPLGITLSGDWLLGVGQGLLV